MTETISPGDTHTAQAPHLARLHTDADAVRAIEDATEHAGTAAG